MALLDSKEIHSIESRLIALLDRTFLKASKLDSMNYRKELPRNVKRWFGSATFEKQLDNLITELIQYSLLYADKQMKVLTAAKVEEGTILTSEAVSRATDLSENAAKSIIRMLDDEAMYYEGPAKLGKRIEDLWQGQRSKAVSFAHTFSADVATGTTVHRYRQYGVRYMEFSAEIDERTTDQCRMMHGTLFDLEKQSVDAYRCPLHFRCRSSLMPLADSDLDESMIFENRDFSGTLDSPDDVAKTFQNIEKFNDKYRVSGFVIDQDIAKRVMLEKGFSVGIGVDTIPTSVIQKEVRKDVVEQVAKTTYKPANTIKEAEQWAKENTSIVNVDYKGLDVKTANAMNESLARHLELNPELASKMKYFGTTQSQAKLAYQLDVDEIADKFVKVGYDQDKAIELAKGAAQKFKTSPNEIASYLKRADDASGIAFNKNMGKSFDALEKRLSSDVKNGFHPTGCDTVKSMMDHEFGHALDDIYDISKSPEVMEIFNTANVEYINSGLSRYALTDSKEFVAEAWAEYLNNPAPREISKKIGDLMISKIKGGAV